MAHFLTLVLVDESDPDPAARAESMMGRYWGDESYDEHGSRIVRVKCDSFVIGGRFDGVIRRARRHDLDPDEPRYGLDVVRPEDNVLPVAELRATLVPFAMVLPDGSWVDREGKSDEAWDEEARALLAHHRARIAVAVDCHC